MRSQRKEFPCDPTSTADAGRSPDPSVLTDNDSDLPALHSRVFPTLRQGTRPAGCRAHSPVPVVSDQREEGGSAHIHSSGLRTALPLYPHAEPENLDGAHSLPAPGKEAAADPEPRGSEGAVGGATQSSPPHAPGDPVRLWAPSRRSHP